MRTITWWWGRGGGVCSITKLCLTFSTPWTGAHQAPLSMDFSRQEYWSGLPPGEPSSRGSSWPRDWTHISCVFCIHRQVLYHWAIREALRQEVGDAVEISRAWSRMRGWKRVGSEKGSEFLHMCKTEEQRDLEKWHIQKAIKGQVGN